MTVIYILVSVSDMLWTFICKRAYRWAQSKRYGLKQKYATEICSSYFLQLLILLPALCTEMLQSILIQILIWVADWHKTSKTYHTGKWHLFVRFMHLLLFKISFYAFLVNTVGRCRTPAVHLFTHMHVNSSSVGHHRLYAQLYAKSLPQGWQCSALWE